MKGQPKLFSMTTSLFMQVFFFICGDIMTGAAEVLCKSPSNGVASASRNVQPSHDKYFK